MPCHHIVLLSLFMRCQHCALNKYISSVDPPTSSPLKPKFIIFSISSLILPSVFPNTLTTLKTPEPPYLALPHPPSEAPHLPYPRNLLQQQPAAKPLGHPATSFTFNFLLTLTITILLFMAFFSLYIRRFYNL
ncbi:hypothetical protein HanRHA438_Chr12g0538161 [Helianthus annuus]|nr:hypothetical protein HanRHA438_Chr12g0538161 [Helianthus annuus]